MNDDMELELSANVEVNGVSSVDKAAEGFSKLATNAGNAEKNADSLEKTFKRLVVNLDTYVNKIGELEKKTESIVNASSKLSPQENLNNFFNKSQSGSKFVDKAEKLMADQRLNASFGQAMGMYAGKGFTMYPAGASNSASIERAITIARIKQENQTSAILSRMNTPKWSYEKEYGVNFAKTERDFDNWSKVFDKQMETLYAEKLRISKEKVENKIKEIIKKDSSSSPTLLLTDRRSGFLPGNKGRSSSDWYTSGRGFVTDFSTPVNEIGRAEFEKSKEDVQERIRVANEEQARIQEQIAERRRKELENLQNQDPGRQVLLLTASEEAIKASQEEIEKAKKEEAEAAKESAKTEKKAAKEMTEFQKKKIEVAEETNDSYDRRTEVFRQSEERKNQLQLETANSRAFRNRHPELFARGGQYHDPRYQTGNALTNVGNKIGSLGTAGKVVGDVLGTIGSFVKGIPAGVATAVTKLADGLLDLGKAATQAYAEIEAIKTQLGVVFSNQTQAESMFGQISQYAVKSPFGVQQTSELAVLLKQSGVYASDLMDTLKMLGDTAGGNMEKMKRIANNYAQIVSIGKASMLDMRQFAYAGIPIFEAVSDELKVSQQELRKMISDGKVTSDIIEKVFKDLTGINGIFENATAKGAKTLKARLQNLSDAKQLALSSIGNGIVNAGSIYGGDSVVNKAVTRFEEFFSWVQSHQDLTNIKRDVNLIANSNSKIEGLKALAEYAKNNGDIELEKLVREELKIQAGIFGVEKQRQVYVSSYDAKMGALERSMEKYGELTYSEIKEKRNTAQNARDELNDKAYQIWQKQDFASNEEKELYVQLRAQIDAYDLLIREMNEYADALNASKKVTEDELNANKERNLINAQQLAYDRANSYADSSSSLMSSFKELNEIYKSSDEYKEKQEEEKNKTLKEALEILKDISKHTEPGKNTIDITTYSADDFVNLVKKGAFEATSKLDVVTQDTPYSDEERKTLTKQYLAFQKKLEEEITGLDADINKRFVKNRVSTLNGKTNEEFYKSFKDLYYNEIDLIDEAIAKYNKQQDNAVEGAKGTQYYEQKKAQAESDKAAFANEMQVYKDALQFSLNPYESLLEASNATVSMIENGGNAFVAFWKRIMSENTGLTTQNMTSPEAALNDYMSDIANRRIVSSVMEATLKTVGTSQAVSLLLAKNNLQEKTLRNAGFGTYQVDWEKSAKAVKEFAMQLSASTEVIAAYRQGLEEEADTLRNIIISSTKYESADLKQNNKIISVKTLGKIAENVTDSQLVNALGRNLSYEGNEVELIGDQFYTTIDGVKTLLSEDMLKNLTISDNIYDVIADYLPKIQRDISEARLQERNNEEFAKWLEKVLPNELSKLVNDSSTPMTSAFLLDNTEYLTEQFYNAFDKVLYDFQTSGTYSDVSGLNKEDILSMGLIDDETLEKMKEAGIDVSKYEHAKVIILEVLEAVRQSADALGSSEFLNITDKSLSIARDEAARNRYRKIMGYDTPSELSPGAWQDEGGYDMRSKLVKDFLGVDKGYTMEDLFKQEGDGLDDLTKKALSFSEALQDASDVMKSMVEETTALIGQLGQKAWLTPFEKWGEIVITGEKWTEKTVDAYKQLGAEALSSLGPIMAKAGFELVARGALDNNWALILGGLGLAAAGGFATGLGGALSEGQEKSKTDKEAEKLQSLKDQLAALLEQARTDALYYENNLRHKTALGLNKEFSYKSVHDAVITPSGDVVTTDPKDYLIATKTPGQFVGGENVTVSPVINCNVVNNTPAQVRQEQTQNEDGSISIVTIIEDAVGQYIASPRSDDAFNMRNYRLNGVQSVM